MRCWGWAFASVSVRGGLLGLVAPALRFEERRQRPVARRDLGRRLARHLSRRPVLEQRQDAQRIDPLAAADRVAPALDEVGGDGQPGSVHADQAVMEVAAGGGAGGTLAAEALAGLHVIP